MTDMPSARFHAAASYLSSATVQASTATKLELYGLFKCITVSPMPSISRPSIFDMTGRAKWDAWNSAGKKYPVLEEAEERYLEIAMTLGWSEATLVEYKPEPSESDSIWDSDDEPRKRGGYSGMGVSVSTMGNSEENADETLHGLAVSGDVASLSLLLEKNPEIDVNGLNDFGYTPLHLSCDRGNLEIVTLLLSKGADPRIKDPDGLTALELARIAGHGLIQETLHRADGGKNV